MARLNQFTNAERLENIKQRAQLSWRTRRFHNDGFLSHVDHAGTEDVDCINHLRAVGVISGYLHQHDSTCDRGFIVKLDNLDDWNNLIELLGYLLNNNLAGINHDGKAVDTWGFGARRDNRNKIVATASKHAGDAGGNTFDVFDQDGQSMAGDFVRSRHYSSISSTVS